MAETVLEKLKNSKVLSGEVQEKLSSLINRYSELKDEEKSQFHENAKDIFKKSLNNLLTNSTRPNMWLTWLSGSLIFLFAILIIIFVFVFFGYKLYTSLSERERKREEKRKLKQLKKKK